MKQNKKTVMIIGCIITICTFIAAVLIGWNHMVKITKGPKNERRDRILSVESESNGYIFRSYNVYISRENDMRQLTAVEMER